MSRVLCCALCALLASPAAAQRPLVITEDTVIDYEVSEELIEVRGGRLTVVDGGILNDIRVFDGASISVLGGDIYNVSTREGSFDNVISGGRLASGGWLHNTVISGGSLEYAMLLSSTRMEGGVILRSDARSATISGGTVHYVQVNYGLPLFVNGGVVGEVEGSFVINDGSIDFGNGAFGFMGDDADFSVNGGHVNRITTSGVTFVSGGEVVELSSTVHQSGGHVVSGTDLQAINFWSGGTRDGVLYASREAVLRVYGYGLSWEGSQLTGRLLDGSIIDNILIPSDGLRVILNEGPPLPGDGDGDGRVGLEDLNGVRNDFGMTFGYSPFDLNYDLSVDLTDLNLVRDNFGNSIPQAVPEPATLWLFLGLAIATLSFQVTTYLLQRQDP